MLDGVQIRAYAQHFLSERMRKFLGSIHGKLCNAVWKAFYSFRMRYYASSYHDYVRMKRLKELHGKRCINVIFSMEVLAKWKSDSLLKLMHQHPSFAPVIRFTAYGNKNEAEIARERAQIRHYAEQLGVPCLEFSTYRNVPSQYKPDLIFISEPYDGYTLRRPSNQGMMNYNLCYIPYGFFTIANEETMNQIANNVALFNFYENASSKAVATAVMKNKGRNVAITGHPMADAFLQAAKNQTSAWKDCGPAMKKIIWAPHWTITSEVSWFSSGNFLRLAEDMVKLAEAHRHDIQFAFKPHPNLYRALCDYSQWGAERTEQYYRCWAEMPNTQLEDGSYADLFMQSDAMIHDSSSFIIEYLFADKPAMFVVQDQGEVYDGYSPLAYEALKSYSRGSTREDIEAFMQSVLKGEDPYADVRASFRQEWLLPPHGRTAAENIVDCILGHEPYTSAP